MFTLAVAGPFEGPSSGTRNRSTSPASGDLVAATVLPSPFPLLPRETIVPSAYATPATPTTATRAIPLFIGDSYQTKTVRAPKKGRVRPAQLATDTRDHETETPGRPGRA